MKKISLFLFMLVTVASCTIDNSTETHPQEPLKIVYDNYCNYGWVVLEIDSCEYLMRGDKLAHKGNCKYCEERRRKQLQNKY